MAENGEGPGRDVPSLEAKLVRRFPSLGYALKGLDTRVTVVMLMAAFLLIVFRKFGGSGYFERHLRPETLNGDPYLTVSGDYYWFLACFVLLGLVPVLVSLPKTFRPRELGLGLGDWRFGLRWTGILFVVMVIVVFVVSRSELFSRYYPLNDVLGSQAVKFFGDTGSTPEAFLKLFIIYEILYAVYFIGWEYFFRGYLTFGLYERLGVNGVLIGNIPFALMHVGKPFPEALGSIIAGVALGIFALRARSFWYGWVLHVAIAWSMDFWALQFRISQG